MQVRNINECASISLPTFADERGSLTLLDDEVVAGKLPFKPRRAFWIYGTQPHTIRGQHAHRSCWEMVCAISGRFTLTLHNGIEEKRFDMSDPAQGIIIPPMVWCRLDNFAPGTVCLAIASEDYDAEGYINDFEHLLYAFKND